MYGSSDIKYGTPGALRSKIGNLSQIFFAITFVLNIKEIKSQSKNLRLDMSYK